MLKTYFKNDFKCPLRLLDRRGAEVVVGCLDFEAEFYIPSGMGLPSVPHAAAGRRYRASRRAGVMENCEVAPDGRLTVVFDGHGLLPGKLWCELTLHSPDPSYPDGERREVFTGPAGVWLTAGPVSSDGHADGCLWLSYAQGMVPVLGVVELESDAATYLLPLCGQEVERREHTPTGYDCYYYYAFGEYGEGIGIWDI